MMQEIIIPLFCAFGGTIGFAILFNVPQKYYFSCGMTGVAGWIVYLLTTDVLGLSSAIASFIGAFTVVVVSRVLTVRMKCPITIFLVSGICPLVPGAGIYFTTYYLFTNDMALAAHTGLGAIKVAFGIVLGIVFAVSIPRQFFQIGYWKQWRILKRRSRKA